MSSVMSNNSQSTLIWRGGKFQNYIFHIPSPPHIDVLIRAPSFRQVTSIVLLYLVGLEINPRTSHMLGKCFTTKLLTYSQLTSASPPSILLNRFPSHTNTQYLLSCSYELCFIKPSSTSQLASFISPSVEQAYTAICPSGGTPAPVEKSQTGREHCF